jgi:microcystin-dependent protein
MNRGTVGGTADVVIPPGVVWEYLGTTPPVGWLLADGSAVSRAQYPALFQAIGVQHGAGNGNTTFNLPNRKGRAGVGWDAGQSEFVSLGTTGGSKTSTASHTHDMGNHQHARSAGGASIGTGYGNAWNGAQGVGWTGGATGQSNGHTHAFITATLGGGAADGLQGWAANDVHNGVQTTDRGGQLVYGGVIHGQSANHDHALEDHSHNLEGHTHGSGGHSHADSFGGAAGNTGDASVVQATSGNLQPFIVVNYIVKV